MKTKKKNWIAQVSVILLLITLISTVFVSSILNHFKVLGNGQLNSQIATFCFDINSSSDSDTKFLPIVTPLLPDFINLFDYRDQVIGTPSIPGAKGNFTVSASNKSKKDIHLDVNLEEINPDNLPIVYAYDGQFYSNIQKSTVYLCLQEDYVFPVTLAGDLENMENSINKLHNNFFAGNDKRSKTIASVKWFWAITEDKVYETTLPNTDHTELRYLEENCDTYSDSSLPVVSFKASIDITPLQ
ncbi:MAG: hypothetical protein RSB90_02205 [Eubacterium sp.]